MIKFVDLFAGTGGIRVGFEQACNDLDLECQCVFSSEIDKKAALSYQLNFGENPFGDITTVKNLPNFDFLLAGFPCQSFSYAGKRKGFADTRGTLFFEIQRILDEKMPKYLLLENVRGLITHDKGRTFETIKNSLENLGYSISHLVLNSSHFGVPQNRVRVYIFGVLNEQVTMTLNSNVGASDTHKFKLNDKTQQISFWDKSFSSCPLVGDILEDHVDKKYLCSTEFLEKLSRVVGKDFKQLHGYRLIDYRGGKSIHSWELGVKGDCSHSEIDFMNLLIENRRKKIFGTHQDGKKLTESQIKTFYHSNNFKQVTDGLIEKGYLSCNNGEYNPICGNMSFEVFKFLDPDGISITLTASDANRLGVVHGNIPRRITPRECARLQGYPDSYKLIDDDNAVYKQMGNGVSVPVVKAVLYDFLSHNYTK